MRLLVDSHVAMWWLDDSPSLGPHAREAIVAADEVFCSVVTPWELGIKRSLGKIDVPDELVGELEASGMTMLPVDADHAEIAPTLPLHHRDPFDRMLIAQSLSEALTLVTADRAFGAYDLRLLSAVD